ncbi:MAG: ABC transporter ATP-binding protein [Sediminibacterium sp.]|jgi:Cu-processing system ATP-binding protein|nr:ABC transporter ATP-binding protein [Hydrotalea sp.]MCU0336242.1 ABC transporter ATP-binding protein [Sediminibacterium sp.]
MIQIEHVYKQFGKMEVLHDIKLTLGKGQAIALIGPNGCGKTTLLKSILRMVIPTKGNIFFEGNDIASTGDHYREKIGYMPQIGRYPDNMKIGQVIETIQSLRSNVLKLDEDLIDNYHLKQLYHKRMSTLSGGTRQKVSAVLSFLFNPTVLILDEPTAGLDPIAAEILKEKILSARQEGKLILITSHLLAELDELISEVIFMQDGSVKFHKSVEVLKDQVGHQSLSKAISHFLKEGAA